jgi:hypothetical protein
MIDRAFSFGLLLFAWTTLVSDKRLGGLDPFSGTV